MLCTTVMRKNKIEGAIKGAGRPKTEAPTHTEVLNVRITEEAKNALRNNVSRMERGKYISRLIMEDNAKNGLI